MPEWYIAVNGQSEGPYSVEQIRSMLAGGNINQETLYGPGFTQWTPLKAVPAPPPPPNAAGSDEIDYRIEGNEMQFVGMDLDPGESAVAEAGAMLYMTAGITMGTIFGDGRANNQSGGILGSLLGAGKRLLTGAGLFITVFANTAGAGKERVAFAAPYAGKIIPMRLKGLGVEMICQKDSSLCAAKGVALEIAFQQRLGVGLFGGEGFIMQRLLGDGWVFLHAGGPVFEYQLQAGETLKVDTGCLVALMPGVWTYDIETVSGIKSALFGGEGLFLARLTGPGHVWLQSLPLSRLANRIYAAARQGGGKQKDEGSILPGALGAILGER